MEDEHDEQNRELLVDREGQANKHAMQQHAELQNGDADDLRRRRVPKRTGRVVCIAPALDVLLRVCVRERLPVSMVVVVVAVGVDALLALTGERGGLLLLAVSLRPVRRVRGKPVAMCIVHDAEACESRGAPAEGDQFDDEDREDANETDAQRVRLVKQMGYRLAHGC